MSEEKQEKNNSSDKISSAKNELEKLYQSSDFKQMPKVGDLVEAQIVAIERKELYVNMSGIFIGIIRGQELSDLSGKYQNLKIGDKIQATVLYQENEKGLLELSIKTAGHIKIWQYLEELKNSEKILEAKIISANKGGLMADINGMQGFLPVSQLSQKNYPRVEGGNKTKILEMLKNFVGQKLKVKIIDIDEKEEKLIISEKDVFLNEQRELVREFLVGENIHGKVTATVDFGIFVEFPAKKEDKKLEGLAHISEISWHRIKGPYELFKIGDEVDAQIIGLDNGKISLSIKKLMADPWLEVTKKFKINDIISGKVVKIDKIGAFIQVDHEIQGLAHISELGLKQGTKIDEVIKINQTYKFKIVSLDPLNHRLSLSLDL